MDEQTQADKEAIAKLTGAKSAMEAALRRVTTLEAAVADQVSFLGKLKSALGTELHASFYESGTYKIQPISDVLSKQSERLKDKI